MTFFGLPFESHDSKNRKSSGNSLSQRRVSELRRSEVTASLEARRREVKGEDRDIERQVRRAITRLQLYYGLEGIIRPFFYSQL